MVIKRGILPFAAIGLLIVGIVFWGYYQLGAVSEYFNLGEKVQYNQSLNDAEVTVMTVNGSPITKRAILNTKVMLEMSSKSLVSEADARNRLIEFTVLWQEAERRGIGASSEEAQQYAETMKKMLQDAEKDPQNAPDNADLIIDYIQGTGQSLDAFFSDSTVGYQKMLSVGNLRRSIYEEVSASLSDTAPPHEEANMVEAVFENLKRSLVEDADIQLLVAE